MDVKSIASNNLRMCETLARAEAQRGISESDTYYAYDEFGKIPIAKGDTMADVQMVIDEHMTDEDIEPCDYYIIRVTKKLVAYHAYLEERED